MQEPQSKVRKISSSAEAKPAVPTPRRKSSTIAAPSPTPAKATLAKRDSKAAVLQPNLVEDISELQSDIRKKAATALVKLFVEQTQQAHKDGAFVLPETQSIDAYGNKLGLAVEYAIYFNFWGLSSEPNSQYREKLMTIIHNVKRNPALRDRLLTQELSPNDFSKMSSLDMASKDLQEKTAEMKKLADKQAVLIEEQRPRIRRTHKGEEFVETPDAPAPSAPDSVFSAPIRRVRTDPEPEVPQQQIPEATSPQSPQAVELPEDVGTTAESPKIAQPLTVDTKAPSRPTAGTERKSSTNFNMEDVWSSVTGPNGDAQKPRQPIPQTESSNVAPGPQAPTESGDADIDRLLKDEEQDEEEPYSPTEYPADPDAIVWRGKMTMQGVADFDGAGKHVAGANLSATIPWTQLMAGPVNIEGRIDIERANTYLCGLRYSKTQDVSVVAISAADDEDSKAAFSKLFVYFTDRKRYGVVTKNAVSAVKDIYLVPLEAGATAKPEFIELLEQCTIESPVPERMLLVTFVIRVNNSPPGQDGTPRQMDTATVVSPLNAGGHQAPTPFQAPAPIAQQPGFQGSPTPAAYQGSPPQPQASFQGAPPTHQYSVPPHQPPYAAPYTGPFGMEAAKQALGDLANAPTVNALLNEAPNAGVVEFQIVRELFESVPATKNNFDMLRHMLSMKLQEGTRRA